MRSRPFNKNRRKKVQEYAKKGLKTKEIALLLDIPPSLVCFYKRPIISK